MFPIVRVRHRVHGNRPTDPGTQVTSQKPAARMANGTTSFHLNNNSTGAYFNPGRGWPKPPATPRHTYSISSVTDQVQPTLVLC